MESITPKSCGVWDTDGELVAVCRKRPITTLVAPYVPKIVYTVPWNREGVYHRAIVDIPWRPGELRN